MAVELVDSGLAALNQDCFGRTVRCFKTATSHILPVLRNRSKMTFQILVYTFLFGLTALCYWLPTKSGNKPTGVWTSAVLVLILVFILLADLSFVVIFIWPVIFAFQIIFISFWAFRLNNLKRPAFASASALTVIFFLIALEPWVSDWTFSKGEANQMLLQHGCGLEDDFEILRNKSGGFLDYAHSFTLRISESDHTRLINKIRSSQNFAGLIDENIETLMVGRNRYDTMDYETNHSVAREYYTKEKMEDGTYHFIIQLSKNDLTLYYLE